MLEKIMDLTRKGFNVTFFQSHTGQLTVGLEKFITMNPDNKAYHVLQESMINDRMVVNSLVMLEEKLNSALSCTN
jgi:hypothetical protein